VDAHNKGIRAEFLPEKYPEFGQCVHKVVQHPDRIGRLFAQNHWGLYRSDDAGDSWQDIARGVPVGLRVRDDDHPHEPETVYIIPIKSTRSASRPRASFASTGHGTAGARGSATRGLPQLTPTTSCCGTA